MQFITFCYRNVLRRKQRSLLTAGAVAIAVAAVVALVGVSTGFQRDFINYYEGVDVDLLVVRSGSARKLTSTLDESLTAEIAAVEGVKEVIPGLADVVSFPDADMPVVPVSGLMPETMVFDHMEMLSGRKIKLDDENVVMLGATIADSLGKTTGDMLEVVEGEEFEVIGVYDGFSVIENGSIVISIEQLQYLMGREGEVSGFSIISENPSDDQQLDRIIMEVGELESGIAVRRTRDHVQEQPEIKTAIGMAWVTSAIAMIIGTLGMLNTMLMSLQERIGEIGLLRAVGWTRQRIASMILTESVLLSILGGVIGVCIAYLLVQFLTWLPVARGFVSGQIDLSIIMQAMAIAIGVGIIGGLLPAMNATRLAPAEALRQ